jgi:hypothetical protein
MQRSERHFNKPDFAAALVLIALGGFAAYVALDYPLGTLRRMGPGFVPLMLSVILMGLGGFLAFGATRATGAEGAGSIDIRLRPTILVLGAMLAWGLLVRRIGFLPATFMLVCLCSLAERGTRPLPTILLASGVCLFGWVVFIYGLKVPLPVLGAR